MSYNPRHAIVRAVRSLPKWARAGILVTAASGSIAGLAVAALPSGASISPTKVYTSYPGQSGYYVWGGRFDTVHSMFYLRKAAAISGGAHGVQLCDNNSGDAAQLGVLTPLGSSSFFIAYAVGTLPPDQNPCAADQILVNGKGGLAQYTTKVPVTVPRGDTVDLRISYLRFPNAHAIQFSAFDATTQVSVWTKRVWLTGNGPLSTYWPQFSQAGIGSTETFNGMTGPADNKLVRFNNNWVRSYSGHKGQLGNQWWTAVQELATTDGTSGGTTRLDPRSSLSNEQFIVYSGAFIH